MKILITGIAGFAGSHLADLLLSKKGVKVYGIDHPKARIDNIAYIKNRLALYTKCDITDKDSVKRALKNIRPDCIMHLAAQSSPSLSLVSPVDTFETNVKGELNILEAVRGLRINPRIIIAGSCEEYGLVSKSELPITENQALKPLNTYAVSKVAQDLLGYLYYKNFGMNIVIARPFNHTGPGQSENFVCSNFAKQIALIEIGRCKPLICVGNLKAKRDFTDVRDIVRAYWLLALKGKPGQVYNICSGKSYSIKEILDILIKLAKVKVEAKVEVERIRPIDVPVLTGSYAKIKKTTRWNPSIPLEDTLKDLLNYWRARLK